MKLSSHYGELGFRIIAEGALRTILHHPLLHPDVLNEKNLTKIGMEELDHASIKNLLLRNSSNEAIFKTKEGPTIKLHGHTEEEIMMMGQCGLLKQVCCSCCT